MIEFEKYHLFLNYLKEIDLFEYFLIKVNNQFEIIESSIQANDLFKSWKDNSTISDFLPQEILVSSGEMAQEGEGMEVYPESIFTELKCKIDHVVVLSLIKNYISILFYNGTAGQIDQEDEFISVSRHYADIYFGFSFRDKKVDFISSSVADLLGYTTEEARNLSFEDLLGIINSDDFKTLQNYIESYTSRDHTKSYPINLEYRIKDKSGFFHYMQQKSISFPLSDRSFYLVGITHDLTETKDPSAALNIKNNQISAIYKRLLDSKNELFSNKKRIENHNLELEKSHELINTTEEIFRQLAENTNDILWLRDAKEILYINNQFERIWGRNRKEVIENPYKATQWIHPDDLANYEPWVNLENLIRDVPYVEQYRIIKPNGEIRWLWSRIFPIFNKENVPYRLVGISTDITEQKEFEDALRIAKEKAQESDMLKSTFLANISHEIRTPMNGIVGFAELLSREDIDLTTRKSYINIMKKSSDQLIHIIDDIIDFAKIESSQIRIIKDKVDINRMLDQLFLFYQAQLKQKGSESISLLVEKSYKTSDLQIYSDEHRIMQVLSYLIENAIKYTTEGFIKFGYNVLEDAVEFYVFDSGIGIPKDKFELIFERFRQVDEGNTRKFGGTGLGLPISKGLVNLLGGNIRVESEINKGSKFYFTIPLSTDQKQGADQQLSKPLSEIINLKDKVILVAEDDELNYEYLKVILEMTEAKIIRAKDGSQVIKICSNLHFDMILMDIRLPVLNGMQATRQLREMGIKTPVIAQTAFAMDDDEKQCLSAGCDGYISKPINKEKLFKLIKKLIR